jgi:ELWxxDGT repeat protein
MNAHLGLAVLAAALCTGTLRAQELVLDLDPRVGNGDSSPAAFLTLGSTTYFAANDGLTGTNLWKTDGTAAGTVLVVDLDPATNQSRRVAALTPYAGGFAFVAERPSDIWDLWVSDGTAAGTRAVSRIAPVDDDDRTPAPFAVLGSQILYSNWSSATNWELWRFDGTSAQLVKDIAPGTRGNAIWRFAVLGGRAFFAADDTTHGVELWKSDGTEGGTVLVADIYPGLAGSSPGPVTTVGSRVLFVASDATNGRELWASDGTTAGTVRLSQIVAGTGSPQIANFVVSGSRLFFTADDFTFGRELYVSDGTATGTGRVVDLAPGYSSGLSAESGSIAAFAGGVMFRGSDATVREELFFSDGSAAGTRLVADINPGAYPPHSYSIPAAIAPVGALAWLQARGRYWDPEPWRSDGTTAGTRLVREVRPGIHGSEPDGFTRLGTRCLFSALEPTDGRELWISDGTAAGTVLLKDIHQSASIAWSGLDSAVPTAVLGEALLFVGDDGLTGREPWISDGTTAGTRILKDIDVDGQSSPTAFLVHAGRAFFAVDDAVHGYEPWITDGTTAGTRLLADLVPGPDSGVARFLCGVGGLVFFMANEPSTGLELWVTDGTAAGTRIAVDLLPGTGSGLDVRFTSALPFGAGILFAGTNETGRRMLFWSDGTAAGTRIVKDLGNRNLDPQQLTLFAGLAYFQGTDAAGAELWRSDGTSAGTVLVADLRAGSGSSSPTSLTVVGDQLFFVADTPATGLELWVTRGTASTTALVADLNPGAGDSYPRSLTASVDRLYFIARDADTGSGTGDELYVSDGTSAGTRLVRDLYPGRVDGCQAIQGLPGSRRVVFAGNSQGAGRELWISDGTAAGTSLLFDLRPGTASSSPTFLGIAGERLLFAADDGSTGREPHAVGLAVLQVPRAVPFGAGCPGTAGRVPQIGTAGSAWLGNRSFGLTLAEARPAAACALLAHLASSPTALGPCTVYPALPAIAFYAFSSPSGTATIPLAVPDDPALSGARLTCQWTVFDPDGAFDHLLAFSAGLELTIGR